MYQKISKSIIYIFLAILLLLIGIFVFKHQIIKSVVNNYDGTHKLSLKQIEIALFDDNINASNFAVKYPNKISDNHMITLEKMFLASNFFDILLNDTKIINHINLQNISINILGDIKENNFYKISDYKKQLKDKISNYKFKNENTNTSKKEINNTTKNLKNSILIKKLRLNNIKFNFINPKTNKLNDQIIINQITLTDINSNDNYDVIIKQIVNRLLSDLKSSDYFEKKLQQKLNKEKEKLNQKLIKEKAKLKQKIEDKKDEIKNELKLKFKQKLKGLL